MPKRRILSLWFPRLGVERLTRLDPGFGMGPVATVAESGNLKTLAALSETAEAEGLRRGQPLRDALAICPALLTRSADPPAEAAFLTTIRRWSGKFSPWVAEDAPEGLVVDLTGCAHLFGGEAALLAQLTEDCADLGLTVRAGLADTLGAAWALARFAGQPAGLARSGDAIDQEAHATRSRASKRRNWERGGATPTRNTAPAGTASIAPEGRTRQAIAILPVASLRLPAPVVTDLTRLGLRHVGDLTGMPRATLARRFGSELVRRLDQALGVEPEPVSPARPPETFSVRMSFPDPIGLEADLLAALDRMLPALEARLAAKGRGARRVRLEASRTDQATEILDVGLARAARDADRIRPLLAMKLKEIDAGFGIDRLRIEAVQTEPMQARQAAGHLDAARAATGRQEAGADLDDLVARLGARVGLEVITRQHPGDSHIPEKAAQTLAAAWSEPAAHPWPGPPALRPLLLWRPEPVMAEDNPSPPLHFRWRGRTLVASAYRGPERIAPEWWLDDPEWRSGLRDYWTVTVEGGERLWLYFAHGGTMSSGWFCHGTFA